MNAEKTEKIFKCYPKKFLFYRLYPQLSACSAVKLKLILIGTADAETGFILLCGFVALCDQRL